MATGSVEVRDDRSEAASIKRYQRPEERRKVAARHTLP